jgi:hypothetical protein
LSEAEDSFVGFEEEEGSVAVDLEEGHIRCHLAELFSVSMFYQCAGKVVKSKRVCSFRKYDCL